MVGVYRGLTRVTAPLIRAWLCIRAIRGREDPARRGERVGIPGAVRPPGGLLWVHAASIGEAVSALGLIERIVRVRPDISVLMTTGTVSAAKVLESRLPPRAIHQYVPADVPRWVDRFIDHWRPGLALWIESEIWPNMVTTTRRSAAAMVLVNARLSERSLRRWARAPATIRGLLESFDLCLAQSEPNAARLRALGAKRVVCPGNLKHAAAPLPSDPEALSGLQRAIGVRPVWLAASTHPGEDERVGDVHRRLRARHAGLLTIIVPRHAERGAAIAGAIPDLRLARRSEGALPDTSTEIYLADTMGELGLFYRAAPIVFVGGSLVPHGGQNPLEPARLGCAIVHGPHMDNFAEIAAEMDARNAALAVTGIEDLAAQVDRLLTDAAPRRAMANAALTYADIHAGVLDRVMAELTPFISVIPTCETGHAGS